MAKYLAGVVRLRPDRLRHARERPAGPPQRLRQAEAARLVEVGDRDDAGQACQRDAVQVASSARSSCPSQCQAVHHSWWSVQLPGVSLPWKTSCELIKLFLAR